MKRSHENPSTDPATDKPDQPGADSSPQDETGFLGRWSRRKRSVAVEEQQVEQKQVVDTLLSEDQLPSDANQMQSPRADDLPVHEPGVAEQAALTDADMPDIDTLNADSDFSPFFSEGVSKELRNLALKKLFFSGKFSIRDGLDDYDDDFTRFEPLGDTVTSDMKFHARRKEKARLAALEEERLQQESEETDVALAGEDNGIEQDADRESRVENDTTESDPSEDDAALELADSAEPGKVIDEDIDESTVSVASTDPESPGGIPSKQHS